MKPLAHLIAVTVLFVLGACGQKATSNEPDSAGMAAAPLATTPSTPRNDLYSDGKTKLVKTVDYRFEVADVKKSTDSIEAAIRKYPAYIASSGVRLEHPILENKMVIRVQSEYFNDLLKAIDTQARYVNFRNVTATDVSKEFVGMEARLKVKREVEDRYREILRHKTGSIKEVLEAEAAIADLHEDIEATIGRINYLRDQVNYSSINLEFYQLLTSPAHAGNEPGLMDKVGEALRSGWQGMVNVAIAIVYIWPIVLVADAVYVYRRRRNFKLTKSPS